MKCRFLGLAQTPKMRALGRWVCLSISMGSPGDDCESKMERSLMKKSQSLGSGGIPF